MGNLFAVLVLVILVASAGRAADGPRRDRW